MPSCIQELKGYYPNGLYPGDFYNKYRNWVNDKDFDTRDIEEEFLPIPDEIPSGFSSEIITQTIIRYMLYIILDSTAEGLKDLSISQRLWFYGNIFLPKDNWSQTHVTKYLSCMPPIIYKEDNDLSHITEHKCEIYEMFRPFYMLKNFGIEPEKISELVPNTFNSSIEYAKKIESFTFYEKYEINCLRELLFQEIIDMVHTNTKIKKCKNCDKYFVTNKSNQVYCSRLFENTGKRCSEIGRSRSYEEKKKNDPLYNLYHPFYEKQYSRIRKDLPDTIKRFNQWQEKALEKYDKAKKGQLSYDEFKEWLEKNS